MIFKNDVKSIFCDSANNWECGFKTFSPYQNTSPGFPVNQFRSIARAFVSEGYVLPECSFSDSNTYESFFDTLLGR